MSPCLEAYYPVKHLRQRYFAKTIIGSKSITIFVKISFLDVLQALEYASDTNNQFSVREQEKTDLIKSVFLCFLLVWNCFQRFTANIP